MAKKKDETASFVLRFKQKVFQNDEGKSQVQWRGNIQHVQGGDEQNFTDFDDVVKFIQGKLADLTLQAIEDKSPEEQKSILAKNFELWKKMALETPKIVMETLKDPKKQLEQVQQQIGQINDNISQKIEERLGQRLAVDDWRVSSKSDYKKLLALVEKLSNDMATLNSKVDELSKK